MPHLHICHLIYILVVDTSDCLALFSEEVTGHPTEVRMSGQAGM